VLQGQIHARADVRGEEYAKKHKQELQWLSRLGATFHSAELFLQADEVMERYHFESEAYDGDTSWANNAVYGKCFQF
jgi:hypothetical protein